MTESSQTSEKLIAIGSALAKGDDVARSLRTWMGVVARADIEVALPQISGAHADDAQRAVLWIALARGWSPASIAGFDTLRKDALERAQPTTTDEKTNGAAESGPLPEAIADGAIPDDEIVTAYVLRGTLARYVEGAAARDPGFAEELAACIDALDAAGENVGEKARSWRKLLEPAAEAKAQAAPDNVVPIGAPKKKEQQTPAPMLAAQQEGRSRSGAFMYVAPIALAASVVLVATGAFVFHQNAKQAEADRAAAIASKQIAEQNAQLEKLMKELDEQNKAIQIAQNEAAMAKSEAERTLAMSKLQAAQEQQRRTSANVSAIRAGGGSTAGNAASPVRAKPACTCQAGDPLCSCL